MYKQYYKYGITICILILIFAYYFNSQNKRDQESIAEFNRHMQLIRISSEISSHVARANGHMHLFLRPESATEREKIFQQAKKLGGAIEKLDPLLVDSLARNLIAELRIDQAAFVSSVKKLVEQHRKYGTTMFTTTEAVKNITELNNITSRIGNSVDSLVDLSETSLQLKKEQINQNNTFKYQALAVLTFISLIFLVVFSYRSGKLSVSSGVAVSHDNLSSYDPLTGMGNRIYFDEEYNKEWHRSLRDQSSFALLLIDVDCFKSFNDTYGHDNGDNCLASIAKCLAKCLKRPSDIIARYGAEEFAIILPATTDSNRVAEDCRQAIVALKMLNVGSTVSKYVTVSIGLGIAYPKRDLSPEEFIGWVDRALSEAKENGRNRIHIASLNNKRDS